MINLLHVFRVKELRSRGRFYQEVLAEEPQLSLRTIQCIESDKIVNGETHLNL